MKNKIAKRKNKRLIEPVKETPLCVNGSQSLLIGNLESLTKTIVTSHQVLWGACAAHTGKAAPPPRPTRLTRQGCLTPELQLTLSVASLTQWADPPASRFLGLTSMFSPCSSGGAPFPLHSSSWGPSLFPSLKCPSLLCRDNRVLLGRESESMCLGVVPAQSQALTFPPAFLLNLHSPQAQLCVFFSPGYRRENN